ncbi:MAG: SHOCT domain-containing protein [Specibacter sp.]
MLTTLTSYAALAAPAMMHRGGYGGPGWWYLIFPLFWLVVIVLFIVLGPRRWHRTHQWQHNQGAESVLRERYARGEIDETEYRARLEVLRSGQK